MKTHGSICQMCRQVLNKRKLTVDHIVPKSQGGSNDISNKQLLCEPCHITKTKLDKEKYCNKVSVRPMVERTLD